MLSWVVLNFILVIYSNATQLTYSLIGLLAMARRVIWIRSVRPFVQRFSWNWLFSFFQELNMVLGAHVVLCMTEGSFRKVQFFFLVLYFFISVVYIVCIHSSFCRREGEGGWAFQKIFKKGGGGWQDHNFYRGVTGKEGVTFSGRWGCNCHIKIKLKSEIFNDKKSL